jgi:hypothetical protein
VAKRKHRPIPQVKAKDIARFWSKVNKTPGHGPKGDCWEWKAGKDPSGYGVFRFPSCNIRAPRLAYFIRHEKDPGEHEVCHTCDNPPCVNPDHLFKGTAKDNADDRTAKGRTLRGERHARSKVTDEQVREIIRLYTSTVPNQYTLAEMFGISQGTVFNILRGHTHKEAHPEGSALAIAVAAQRARGPRKFNDETITKVRELYASGRYSQAVVAGLCGVSISMVSKIVLRNTRKDCP